MSREIVCLWVSDQAYRLYENCEKSLNEMMTWYEAYDLDTNNRAAVDTLVARTHNQMAKLVSEFTVPAVVLEKMPPPP